MQEVHVAARFGLHGMPLSASNMTGTVLGQDGSDWSRDLVILTFDLGGHGACGWCASSFCIRVPSLEFVGLAVRMIWQRCVWTLTGLWPWNWYASCIKIVNLPSKFEHARPLGSRVIRYVRDGQTNGRTDRQKQRLLPLAYGRRHDKRPKLHWSQTTPSWQSLVSDIRQSIGNDRYLQQRCK